MRTAGILALTVLAVLCGTVNAQHEALRIGVVDFTSDNVPDAQLRILSDRLRIELHNTGEFTVVERDRMEDILGEQGFRSRNGGILNWWQKTGSFLCQGNADDKILLEQIAADSRLSPPELPTRGHSANSTSIFIAHGAANQTQGNTRTYPASA